MFGQRMRLLSLLVVLVLSLSQIGCSDDQTGGQSENNASTEDVATDTAQESATDAAQDADLDGAGFTDNTSDADEANDTDEANDAEHASDADDASDTADASDSTDAASGDTDTSADAGCTQGDTKEVECNTCTCMSDGTWACTKMECTYDPCAGKSCGDNCTICAPDDPNCVETDVIKTCRPDGTCSAGTPSC